MFVWYKKWFLEIFVIYLYKIIDDLLKSCLCFVKYFLDVTLFIPIRNSFEIIV